MSDKVTFQGFSVETVDFLRDLRTNNSKRWFEAHRTIFDNMVMKEARDFVLAMGERLRSIAPEIVAEPKIDRSIFRFHRDVRFSKDKSPYKTHLGIYFWEGPFKKLECSGFYFHLEPERLFIGVGIYMFSPPLLKTYRDAVVDPELGTGLMNAIDKVKLNPDYHLGWEKYKRVPRGYDPEHPNAYLLRFGGLGFDFEETVPDALFTDACVDYVLRIFSDMAPIHFWLRILTETAAGKKGWQDH